MQYKISYIIEVKVCLGIYFEQIMNLLLKLYINMQFSISTMEL